MNAYQEFFAIFFDQKDIGNIDALYTSLQRIEEAQKEAQKPKKPKKYVQLSLKI